MKKITGFTLIEILIALVVFTIIATLTSASMRQVFNSQKTVNAQADQLIALQLAFSLLKIDTEQIINRSILADELRPIAAFMGSKNQVEFTRGGIANPLSQEKKSSLKRIALLCKGDKLLRRSWPALDPIQYKHYEEKLLIDNLSQCQFHYLNQQLQSLDEWRENAVSQSQRQEPLPKAIQLNLAFKTWGKTSLLFMIPGAVYGDK